MPLWGSRRRSYLLLMGGALTAAWAGLALRPDIGTGPLLGAMAVSALALAFINTVTAGLLAELSPAPVVRVGGSTPYASSQRKRRL